MKNENNIYGYVRVSSIERLGRDYEKRTGKAEISDGETINEYAKLEQENIKNRKRGY